MSDRRMEAKKSHAPATLRRGKRRRKRPWKNPKALALLAVLMVALVAVCLRMGVAMRDEAHKREAERAYQELAQAVSLAGPQEEATDATEAVRRSPIDFDALRRQNPDVVAWLRIPDTNIDYPVVQGEDNEHYLTHDFSGQPSPSGALFADAEISSDFSSDHSIIYGHNMRSGTMFAKLRLFEDGRFFASHHRGYLYLPDGTYKLTIFAVGVVPADADLRRFTFDTFRDKLGYWSARQNEATLVNRRDPHPGDRLLSLVTCVGEGDAQRLVLYCVMEPR